MNNIVAKIVNWFSIINEFFISDIKQFFRQKLEVVATFLTGLSMIISFGIGMQNMSIQNFGGGNYFSFIAPGIFVIGIMFGSTFSIGFSIIMDKQRRTIEDIVLSSFSFSAFLLSRHLGIIFKILLQFIIIFLISILFFSLHIYNFILIVACIFLSCIFFSSIGILVATFATEISFTSIINLFVLPSCYFSGVFFPLENFGQLKSVLEYLPVSIFVTLFRVSVNEISIDNISLLILLIITYSLFFLLVSSFIFRWKIKSQ